MMFQAKERKQRIEMVEKQLKKRGITDRRVLAAMRRIPRHSFVPSELREHAYEDRPLDIGERQTISQPYMVALMTQCAGIHRRDRVLEIGTGSGYHAAVLSLLCHHVWSMERIETLFQSVSARLSDQGIRNVTLLSGNGSDGHPEHAPYEVIMVAAAISRPPPALLAQLAESGRLVIPIGPSEQQELKVYKRTGGQWQARTVGPCRFVPFVP